MTAVRASPSDQAGAMRNRHVYLPPHFEESSAEEIHAFIEQHPFGALVVNGPRGLEANHLPFLLDTQRDGSLRLVAHVARANNVWHDTPDGSDVLVIFNTAGAYISPTWYPSKAETHQNVPTWNYQAVHVRGHISIHDDETFVRGVVARLTRDHERRVEPERPWKMTDSPREFIDQMVRAIVGIEICVTQVEAKWKLGQNRQDRDRLGAADALEAHGDADTSAAMRRARRDR